jgi:hypothetical protein
VAKSKKNTPGEPVIDDGSWRDHFAPVIDGQPKGHGLVPRDYATYPAEMFAPPTEIKLIPRSEWSARIKDQEKQESRISDVMKGAGVPCLDQGQVGYCWAHSSTGAVMAVRALNGQPTVPLSAYAVAATIKKGADEGGWCGLSAQFIREKGVPSQQLWPQGDRSYRKYDKADVWANAALHKVTEDYVDLTRDVYDQNLTFDMVASCFLSGIPVAVDFNWWSHSVLGCDLVETEPGAFGLRIRNSWGASWGEQGFGILKGSKAIPDGAVALRVTGGSPT